MTAREKAEYTEYMTGRKYIKAGNTVNIKI